jgi:hypothetical protein
VGSFTFTYDGRAPDDTRVRIGLLSSPLTVIDFTMDISGNDRNEVVLALAGIMFWRRLRAASHRAAIEGPAGLLTCRPIGSMLTS